jgi:hypothetical protein
MPARRLALLAALAALGLVLSACGAGSAATSSTNLERPGPSSTRTRTPTPLPPSSPTDGGTTEPPVSPTPTSTPPEPELSCPSRALLGVYRPERLHVVARCRLFVGVVTGSVRQRDGDVRIYAVPTRAYQRFLNATNRSALGGRIVIEVIDGQPMVYFLPRPGERISVLGTLVRDVEHGWNAMYPIWEIRYPGSGTLIYAVPPDPPLYHPGS